MFTLQHNEKLVSQKLSKILLFGKFSEGEKEFSLQPQKTGKSPCIDIGMEGIVGERQTQEGKIDPLIKKN